MENSKKIKIIFSNYDDLQNPFYGGGGARAIHEVAKRLTNRYQVTVITGVYPGAKDELVDDVKYKRIGFFLFSPKISQLIFHFFLPFVVSKHSFDVWMESFTPPVSSSFLPLFTRKPVIGLVHFLSGEDMFRKYKLPFFIIEAIGLRTYQYFILVAEFLKDKILKINPRAFIEVIPNGLEDKLLKTKFVDQGKYILFMGRIEVNQKGLDLLLGAYKEIENKVMCKLIIAGPGLKNEVGKLQKLIRDLNLDKKVSYIGKVEHEAKFKTFENALIIVVPSRYETFPITVLESFAFAKSVIVFDIPAMEWISNDICYKVKPFEKNLLAKGMLDLIQNNTLRNNMGIHAKKFSQNFDWDKVAQKYDKFIKRTLSETIKMKVTTDYNNNIH